MGIDGIGSSVVIALAAVLWFVYLVPTWLRRREYLATERNAVRLQRTVRIMAESAELPAVVRVEATARSAAMQEKALRKEQQLSAAIERAQAAASARALSRSSVGTADNAPRSAGLDGHTVLASRRLRRSRAFASFVLLASVVAAGIGVNVLLVTGAWALLAAAAAVALGAVVLLGQMAAVAKARMELARAVRAVPVASQLHDRVELDQPQRQSGWTPVPLPKPLYLSRPVSATLPEEVAKRPSRRELTGVLDPVASLRAAALAAERALREAQSSPEVTRISRPAATSRFASMGVVDQTDVVKTDLDAILSRRRAAG
ncbi:MAG TPA: hypothetical protein VIQ78_01135 [Terrimesophilobacter sp.]|uniref:hypothetical protein n=1 Tax=Terrimesophilobacter sp. TaxID=2906435 RepID=UPI002F93496B